jgi:outer membrane biosynthesis protein TonB
MSTNSLRKLWEFFDPSQDSIFMLALAASLLIHAITLSFFAMSQAHARPKPFKKLEVVYQAVPVQKEMPRRAQEVRPLQEQKEEATPDILTKKDAGPQSFMKDLMKAPSQYKIAGKQPTKLNMDVKRQVAVPLLESEKIMNPRYLNYNERIREKIRNRAYFYVETPDFKVGEVYLTFVLLSDGSLKEVKIIDEKSHADDYLRNIGLRSIKESAPFPAFPSDLKYPELTFNVIISFEVNAK